LGGLGYEAVATIDTFVFHFVLAASSTTELLEEESEHHLYVCEDVLELWRTALLKLMY